MAQTINISALTAREIKCLTYDTVLISINNTDVPLHELSIDRNSCRVLTVRFDDITANVTVKGREYKVIDGDTAIKIIEFVEHYKHKNFLVHCHAGISRSAAVCMFIHLIYGHSLKKDFWQLSHPNPYVLGKLISVYKQLKDLRSQSS